ncbi:MAG: hypothetical protein WBY94_13925 [Polyangiaceae bacterium]
MNNAALAAIRDIAAKAAYPYTLSFTREFTSGTLAGLTHDDKLGFCAAPDAEEWVSSVNGANRAGKLEYKVIAWKVSP